MAINISVELLDIGKCYGKKVLFTGVQAVVGPGECLVITGCNGSGKSTLLKIIAGLVTPSTGTVQVMSDKIALLAEEKSDCLGMVSPEVVLYNALTGYENVNFFAHLRGRKLENQDVSFYLKRVGLDRQQHDLVASYSTGMRQRLKFAILLAVDSALWLLDEPSSNLDSEGKVLVGTLIAEALQAQRTLVLATNEVGEVSYATRQITLA